MWDKDRTTLMGTPWDSWVPNEGSEWLGVIPAPAWGDMRRGAQSCAPSMLPALGPRGAGCDPSGTLGHRAPGHGARLVRHVQRAGCSWGQLGVVPSPVEVTKPPRLPCVCGAPAVKAVAERVPPTGGEAVVRREIN